LPVNIAINMPIITESYCLNNIKYISKNGDFRNGIKKYANVT